LCGDTNVNVTEGKRLQRSIRYDKLREEFFALINKIFDDNKQLNNQTDTTKKLKKLEKVMEQEKNDFNK
jgi:hypothetical protein